MHTYTLGALCVALAPTVRSQPAYWISDTYIGNDFLRYVPSLLFSCLSLTIFAAHGNGKLSTILPTEGDYLSLPCNPNPID